MKEVSKCLSELRFFPKALHRLPDARRRSYTHTPPCHRVLTDGSYSYYLTFIKRPQCARSCMEQGCGWSQRICPQKAMAKWREGDGPLFPIQSPLLPASSDSSLRSPTGASRERCEQGSNMSEACTSCFVCDK